MTGQKKVDCNVKARNRNCMDCGKAIKANIVNRKENPVFYCFPHFKMRNPGHSRRNYAMWPRKGAATKSYWDRKPGA